MTCKTFITPMTCVTSIRYLEGCEEIIIPSILYTLFQICIPSSAKTIKTIDNNMRKLKKIKEGYCLSNPLNDETIRDIVSNSIFDI